MSDNMSFRPTGDSMPTPSTVPDNVHASCSTTIVDESRRSKRQRTETSFGPEFIIAFLSENASVDLLSNERASAFMIEYDPKTYDETMRSMDVSFWKEAIKGELDSTISN